VNAIRDDVELENGRKVYLGLGIGNPATGFGAFMPLGGPGSPTVLDFVNSAFLPYIVFSDRCTAPTPTRWTPIYLRL
jgi:hypothetical protein